MSILDRMSSLFRPQTDEKGSTEPPHALRQHFSVTTRTISGFEVYSVAPLRFADANQPDSPHYDPHTNALGELAPSQTARKAVLYVLPGGFAKSIQPRNWDFIGQMAEAGLRVEIPLYGLVPIHSVADALPLLRQTYTDLVADHGAENITVIADSAGGSLALGLFIADALEQQAAFGVTSEKNQDEPPHTTAEDQPVHTETPEPRLPRPKRIILNAPWVDMDLSNPEIETLSARDPILDPAQLRPQGNLWSQGLAHLSIAPSAQCTHHPIVSPINLAPASLWAQILPDVTIDLFCGDRDLSLADTQKLQEIFTAAGLRSELHLQSEGVHMYHLAKSREGRVARKMLIDMALNTA